MVARLWPESTVVCIASGPSLTPEDVDACRGRARVIAINDSHRLAPWADCLYACDGRWWDHYKGVPEFKCLKFGLTVKKDKWPGVTRLPHVGPEGINPKGICDGSNSGYQAVQLAVHLGAVRIVLLGYDMKPGVNGRDHWFGKHPVGVRSHQSPYESFRNYFKALAPQLRALGVDVVNCSRETALTCFPRQPLAEALPVEVAA